MIEYKEAIAILALASFCMLGYILYYIINIRDELKKIREILEKRENKNSTEETVITELCIYIQDFEGEIETWTCSSCGERWCLNDATPKDNRVRYCTGCGAKIADLLDISGV